MPVQTRGSAKRPRDEGEVSEDEPATKRPSTPFFRRVEPSFHERARSARKATPARGFRPVKAHSAIATSRFRSDTSNGALDLVPFTDPEDRLHQTETIRSETVPPTPQNQQSTVGWLWNSAKKYIPRLRTEDNLPAAMPPSPDQHRSTQNVPNEDLPPIDWANPPYPRLDPLDPVRQDRLDSIRAARRIRNNPNKMDSRPFETFFRNNPLPTADDPIVEEDEHFNTRRVPGTNKRKLTDEHEESAPTPATPTNSFQPPSVDDEDEDDAEGVAVATPTKQPQAPATALFQRAPPGASPLKSAMWTGTRSKRNVGFDESTFRHPVTEPPKKRQRVYKDLGPAGHYTGTTFRDPADDRNKARSKGHLFQPVSKPYRNNDDDDDDNGDAYISTDPKFNQPNCFGISLEDLEADEEDITPDIRAILARAEAADAAKEAAKAAEKAARAAEAAHAAEAAVTAPPPPPSAPRPSHAELPSIAKPAEAISGATALKPSQTALEQIEQQRKLATKYKPKNSSGLARVEPARSRSSSPPRGTSRTITSAEDVPALVADENAEASDEPLSPSPPSVTLSGDIGSSLVELPLDNTVRGEDGMTDYEREHQYDEWARNLDWPEPQTYVEAGLCSAYIDDLLRKKWSKEDEKITSQFWTEEFDDVDRMMEAAKRKGHKLELVYGDAVEI